MLNQTADLRILALERGSASPGHENQCSQLVQSDLGSKPPWLVSVIGDEALRIWIPTGRASCQNFRSQSPISEQQEQAKWERFPAAVQKLVNATPCPRDHLAQVCLYVQANAAEGQRASVHAFVQARDALQALRLKAALCTRQERPQSAFKQRASRGRRCGDDFGVLLGLPQATGQLQLLSQEPHQRPMHCSLDQ